MKKSDFNGKSIEQILAEKTSSKVLQVHKMPATPTKALNLSGVQDLTRKGQKLDIAQIQK